MVDEIVLKDLSEIKPYFRNPRKNDKTVAALVDIIPKTGFNVPLLIDRNNVIVKGHARYNAAIRLGLKKIPCVVTYADEETIRLDRLADNKVSELSEWVDEQVMHELDMMDIDSEVAGILDTLGFQATAAESIFDDDDFDYPEYDNREFLGESEEDRRARYQQYLEDHPAEAQAEPMATKASIDRAMQKQQAIPEKPKRYYKLVCEHCGHIMFVAEGEAVFEET
jgi:ParB-like chromosome segregation protein Spo0J